MPTNKEKFDYAIGFLDCWIFMSGRNSMNKQLLRDRHVLVLDLMRQKYMSGEPLEPVQYHVNDMSREKIFKEILDIATKQLDTEGMKKILKNMNYDSTKILD